jgi:hypothetical protein
MVSEKVLTDSRDSFEKQKNEWKVSLLRAEVRISRPVLYFNLLILLCLAHGEATSERTRKN